MAGKVAEALGGDLSGKTIGVLGLTFKPNTDDMREAPSIQIIPALQDGRARPGLRSGRRGPGQGGARGVDFSDGPYDCAEGADALVILTEWDQFRALDLDRVRPR